MPHLPDTFGGVQIYITHLFKVALSWRWQSPPNGSSGAFMMGFPTTPWSPTTRYCPRSPRLSDARLVRQVIRVRGRRDSNVALIP